MAENRIALIGIIVEEQEGAVKINQVLHEFSKYIVGRMGVPYHERELSVISVILDAPGEIINAVSGKLGMIPGVNTKTVYAKESRKDKEGKM